MSSTKKYSKAKSGFISMPGFLDHRQPFRKLVGVDLDDHVVAVRFREQHQGFYRFMQRSVVKVFHDADDTARFRHESLSRRRRYCAVPRFPHRIRAARQTPSQTDHPGLPRQNRNPAGQRRPRSEPSRRPRRTSRRRMRRSKMHDAEEPAGGQLDSEGIKKHVVCPSLVHFDPWRYHPRSTCVQPRRSRRSCGKAG